MYSLESLKQEAQQLIGHRLPKETFSDFAHPNNRMLAGVTCLHSGYIDLAYQLFATIVEEGPKENPNHHFAYVRSMVEMAEIDAERKQFSRAAEYMQQALASYPESMGYMMSRVHLEVYLAYYLFQAGKKEEAIRQIKTICDREIKKFQELPIHDAQSLVGPGLCYAIHQWSLFYAMEEEWELAVAKFKEMLPYAVATDSNAIREAEEFLARGKGKQAFSRYEEAVRYKDGE